MIQSKQLYTSYHRTYNFEDMQQAAYYSREILDRVSPNISSMPTILLSMLPQDLLYMVPILLFGLGKSLMRKFRFTRQVEDITKAIEMFRGANYHFQLVKDDGGVVGPKCIEYLSLSYLERDGNLDGFPELSDFVRPFGISLETFCVKLGSRKPGLIHILGEDWEMYDYFLWTLRHLKYSFGPNSEASLEDLNSVIHLYQQARKSKFFSSKRHFLGFILPELGGYLYQKSVSQTDLEALNEAVQCSCVGLKYVSRDNPFFGDFLLRASEVCVCRSQMMRSREDLDAAVRYAKQAMEIIDSQDRRFVRCLDNLRHVMLCRYESTGDAKDLDTAIDALRRVVDIQDHDGHPNPIKLNNLCASLKMRFERSGRYEDLTNAVAVVQRALDLLPPDDSEREITLMNLGSCEISQCLHLRDRKYLGRGIQHIQEAWSTQRAHPFQIGDDPERIIRMTHYRATLAGMCNVVSEEQPDLEALDNAIAALSRVTHAFPHHPEAVRALNVLCDCLCIRWRRTPELRYIDEAISVAQRVVSLTEARTGNSAARKILFAGKRSGESSQDAVLARRLLGELLYERYRSTGNIENREEALALLEIVFQSSEGSPNVRIDAGQVVIDILSELAEWHRARQYSKEVINLLLFMNGRSLGWHDKQYWVSMFSLRAAEYASIALEAGSDVLDVIEMLELCRGSVLGHLIDSRTDLNDLTGAAPEEAEQFRTLMNEMNTVIDPSESTNTRLDQTARKVKAEEIRSCVQKIRALESFHRFGMGPTQRELEAAAARGPIVLVNISPIRCDAIIITKDALTFLPLPELKYQKAKEYLDAKLTSFFMPPRNKIYRQLQKWLWDTCVKLIFQKLGDLTNDSAKFHVWWIGIGIASSLPFHAAGIYNGNMSETALSRAISSYVPTIKILIHSQRKFKDSYGRLVTDVQGKTTKPQKLQFKPWLALIVMPSTPGRLDLKGAQEEAEEVQRIVQDTYLTQILLHPSAKDTMAQMSECDIVHFACHGESSIADPSSSHLLLQATNPDTGIPAIDELALRDVAAAHVSHGTLAFLSACSTAQDGRHEGLHLASGFQVAGYLHAIGNLWPTDDQVSVQVAKEFYEHLVAAGDLGNGENVAKALNEALIVIAKDYGMEPLCWAQFVHFGI